MLLGSFIMVSSFGSANELWVTPTRVETPLTVSTWPVTGAGVGRFSFAIPDNLTEFTAAKIVVLPGVTANGNLILAASNSKDGEDLSQADFVVDGNVPFALTAGVLTEVDVTGLLSSLFEPDSPGLEYVGVIFAFPTSPPPARVLGMRVQYVGPAGPEGPEGQDAPGIENLTIDNNVTAAGINAAQQTVGLGNTAFGGNALRVNTDGNRNTALGRNSMQSNLVGIQNVALGRNSLVNLTSGDDNIALGHTAGSGLTGGAIDNILIGANGNAGDSGTIRIGRTGVHTTAYLRGIFDTNLSDGTPVVVNSNGQLGISGVGSGLVQVFAENTAAGNGALENNTTGDFNTANGAGALEQNTTGAGNTAMGQKALLQNMGGADNTAVGRSALQDNTEGRFNVGVWAARH